MQSGRFLPDDPARVTETDELAMRVKDVSLRTRRTNNSEVEMAADLEQTRADRDRFHDLARHAQSQLENYRARTLREISQLEQRTLARFVLEFVPVLDNLELALSHATDGDSTARGVMMIYDEMAQVLRRLGVQSLKPEPGDEFDPHIHEAMSVVDDSGPSRAIVEVLSQGYCIGDQVLRPARVVVAR